MVCTGGAGGVGGTGGAGGVGGTGGAGGLGGTGGAGGLGGTGGPEPPGPPVVEMPSEGEEPLRWNPHPVKKVVNKAMMVIPAVPCLLNVARPMTTGGIRLRVFFIALSHRKPECLPVRLSTGT
jgi:hypothetical protein